MSAPDPSWHPAAAALVAAVLADYTLDPAEVAILHMAADAITRAEEAKAVLAETGVVTSTAAGGLKTNPAFIVERDSRAAAARLLAALQMIGPDTDG